MFVFGIQNFFIDLGSFRAPSLIPLGTYTASVPVAGALIVLFTIEQLINGWRNGFEGPEDADDFAGIVK
jgi:TRAP-type C4-dicarboxylate transport system permease small subunit